MNLIWHKKLPRNKNRQRFAKLGLPHLLAVWHKTAGDNGYGSYVFGKFRGMRKWKALAQRLPQIEAELTLWEDAHPEEYKALPWYEAREEFRGQKARGEVVWPKWWELAGASAACTEIIKTQFRKG